LKPRLRALVLAAGRGERLRPLSDVLPKPLLPVAGEPVAGRTLARLRAAGCEAAALNLHHLGEAVRRRFGDRAGDLPLHYSPEAQLLGTLGALLPLRDFLGEADLILVVNGDSLCRWPVVPLVRRHLRRGADATLLVARRADPARFGGGIGLDGDGRVVSLRGGVEVGAAGPAGPVARRRVFAGAQVLAPRLLERVTGPGDLVTGLYMPLLGEGGRVESLETGRRWHDLGTPRRYLAAVLEWARVRWRGSWRAASAVVEGGARVRRAVLEGAARVERGARVEESLLLPGAVVGRGGGAWRSILGPGVVLPPGTQVERRLVTTARAGVPAGPLDSVVGGLVYTPLDP
jgi:NDP-sugar pyrophosphorylase family protein